MELTYLRVRSKIEINIRFARVNESDFKQFSAACCVLAVVISNTFGKGAD